jgi:hypothetical protein
VEEAGGAKRFGKGFFGLRFEIPQSRQSFPWKCLGKQAEVWKPFVRPPLPLQRSGAGLEMAHAPLGSAPPNRGADRAHFDRDRLIKSPLTGMIQVVAIGPTASQSRTGV